MGTAEVDLEHFECLSSKGNGSIMIYPDLDNASLPQDLFARVQRNHGFDCMLRLRCSRGFKVIALFFVAFVSFAADPFRHSSAPHSRPFILIAQVARAYGNLFPDREFENLSVHRIFHLRPL